MGFGEEVEGETFPAAGDEGAVEGPEVFFFLFFFCWHYVRIWDGCFGVWVVICGLVLI